ncbi:MAG: FecR domain-containing protein [Odoribacteraceae bacterium]|jgi:ferric-dicitrate binding protein FerR (iron transport regulator)|nr:FecR domain-containing protein [Odoribacteraceae bacterium]
MNRLLAKYIFNEASPRERERVERWLDGNPRRRQELEELRARIDLAARRYRHGMFDARRALARVLQRRGNTRALVSRVAATAAVIALVAGSWLLLVPSPRATTLVALPGETRASLLPDGSRVTLEGPSSLEYATGFDETREVSVTGTAYFEVTSDPRRPFIVHSALLDVRVLGTTFQVEGDATRAGVLVREGRVLVLPAGEQGGEVLVAGMSAARVAGEDGLTVSPFDLNRLSWKTGEFRFRDAPLSEVAALFNRHFRVAISLPDSLSSLRVTASFDRPTLREALDVINQTLGTTIPAVTLPEK